MFHISSLLSSKGSLVSCASGEPVSFVDNRSTHPVGHDGPKQGRDGRKGCEVPGRLQQVISRIGTASAARSCQVYPAHVPQILLRLPGGFFRFVFFVVFRFTCSSLWVLVLLCSCISGTWYLITCGRIVHFPRFVLLLSVCHVSFRGALHLFISFSSICFSFFFVDISLYLV